MPRNRSLTHDSSLPEVIEEGEGKMEESYSPSAVTSDDADVDDGDRSVWKLKDLRKSEQVELSKFTHGKMRASLSFDNKHTCRLCGRNGKDKGTSVGSLIIPVKDYDFAVHELCIMLASQLPQDGDNGPLLGFRISKLLKEFNRGKKVKCSFCDHFGATVECCDSECNINFHVPCGREHDTFHVFSGQYQSFCSNHRPDPPTLFERAPRMNLPFGYHLEVCSTICALCTTDRVMMKAVMGEVVRTTCCSRINRRGVEEDVNRYYHFVCIQNMALMAGAYLLKCPFSSVDGKDRKGKKHQERFKEQVILQGIYVPIRDADWEIDGSQDDMVPRAPRCVRGAGCLSPTGSDSEHKPSADEPRPSWELLRCDTCGSIAVHRNCAGTPWSIAGDVDEPAWNCADCCPIADSQ